MDPDDIEPDYDEDASPAVEHNAGASGDDDLDLYSGFAIAPVDEQAESHDEVRARADELEAKCRAQEQRIQKLEKQTQLLTAQNTALKKNISCLYKTAKLEIERKDQEIARLRRPSHPSSTS